MTQNDTQSTLQAYLNPQAVRGRFQAELESRFPRADWSTLQMRRALPRPPDRLLVEYRLRDDRGGDIDLGTLLPLSNSERFSEPRLHVFPDDPELGQLAGLHQRLSGLGDCILLSHRLGRRCVFLVSRDSGEGASVWKALRPRKLEAVMRNQEQARASLLGVSGVRVPALLSRDEAMSAYEMEYFGQPSLFAASSAPAASGVYERAGRSLRALHGSAFRPSHRHGVDEEIELLRSWNELLAELLGERCAVSRELVDRAVQSRQLVDISEGEQCGIHRDFYDKQVLVGSERDVLLDFDLAAVGDPALDVGNFLAHVRLRALQRRYGPEGYASRLRSFLRGYDRNEIAFQRRVDWWQAVSLARLALLYSLRPAWRSIAPDLEVEARMLFRRLEES